MEKGRFPGGSAAALRVAAVVCALSLAAAVVCAVGTAGKQASFEPPAFDQAALAGVPEVPEGLGWGEVWQEGMDFKAGVCGTFPVRAGDGGAGEADVWFANLSESAASGQGAAWLKLRVLDASGAVLGETGLLRPGEYVQGVAVDPAPAAGDAVTLAIMAYEPDTYHSLGSVTLSTAASAA